MAGTRVEPVQKNSSCPRCGPSISSTAAQNHRTTSESAVNPLAYTVLARQSAMSMTGVPQISNCSSPTVQHCRSVASSSSLMKTEKPALKASTCTAFMAAA